jgi:hypothetical protein
MSNVDDELTRLLRRAERPVAMEGLFESLERRAGSLATKRSHGGPWPPHSQRAWELFLTILRSVKR